ncbi:FkbM family methyltransferase, partial [Anaeromassilibacillus sp. An200]|uniref:FkbM family methyltransferase n=1 Tax=Anaeromassilibacillus sp. An200 TaxID=1965587 RepID=UPI000B38C9D5
DSRVMQKEQREEMLEYLLSQPISGKQQEMMASACKVEQISKEARKNLWEKLSQYSVPSESISSIIHALIQSKVMQKKQREEMLSYLLSCPLSTKQMKECILKAVEFSTNHKIFEFSKIFESYLNFQNAINNLTPWIDEERLEWKNGKETALKKVLFEGIIPQDALLDLICTEHICYLKDACIEFIDRKQLWLMMEELLFSEEYYCQFSCKEPYVLDCGTNIGLAIYYIKHYYPEAHIEGFEPWKTAFDCAVRNVERNGWKNVTIHHAAVGGKEDVMQLTVVAENSLAGSLAGRLDEMIERKHWEKSVENVKVVKLSDYINRPVNFLKMDIEGLENEVIEEIKEKLPNISQMFVEYHYGSSMKDNSLIEILKILSDAGFVYQISKSLSYTELTRKRPFAHVGKMVSELIWAVKK